MTDASQSGWTLASLREQLEADLIAPTPSLAQWIDGRLVGVLASPELESASQLALGVSALPKGVRGTGPRARCRGDRSHSGR